MTKSRFCVFPEIPLNFCKPVVRKGSRIMRRVTKSEALIFPNGIFSITKFTYNSSKLTFSECHLSEKSVFEWFSSKNRKITTSFLINEITDHILPETNVQT